MGDYRMDDRNIDGMEGANNAPVHQSILDDNTTTRSIPATPCPESRGRASSPRSFRGSPRAPSPQPPPAAGAAAAAAPESSSAAGDPSSAQPLPAREPLGLLNVGVLAVVTAALGGTGYVSYAYSLEEIDQKTREFRQNSKHPISDDLSVPIAAIEFYLDIRSQIEDQIHGFSEPSSNKLLPDLLPQEQHVFTLVLDLNETLVYSDWKRERGWRTFKRPGVDVFLEHLGKFYEIVVYSDQQSMYVDPVVERLDPKGQRAMFGTGCQELQLNMKMENIIGICQS
ncbi:hypothetical protein GUJ93_ZPchr0007g5314 [Zizania palustris]|uniref:Mitochondrial import inner membrane translocase subunit TIM50 n=1 Tax=Zizania palustris TaxID=103762 RepID=A0A8J5TIH1_ZIZPA|nr:hypothetical protein GUJ93_ZPchr0007g5314 [Zizania palustris]KAG8078021.1 hypothetical protein GUJ93_ZPchr0007g5314 [Zizania palustris]KAG8078022.1 hypothetical protein GUJ93_ZPchr0007g5314 [Zizania palustris]